MGEVYDYKPTKIDSKKAAGDTVLYFFYMLLPVSLQRNLDIHLKKNPAAQAKNTVQDQSALVFSSCYTQRLL